MQRKYILGILLIGLTACDDLLEIENISNAAVVLLAPTNNVIIDTTAVNFTWETLEGADNYQLQIATPSFEAAQQIVKDTTLANTNILVNLENGEFQWRVRAKNSGYQTDYTTLNFEIEE